MSDPAARTAAARPPEAVVARLRAHGRHLFWPLALLVVLAGATVYAVGVAPEGWMRILALGAGALLAIVGVLAPLLRWATRQATITTRRIALRSGVLAHTRRELHHSRGYGITVRRSGLQHLFRSGDVTVAAGEDPPLVLRDISQPHLVAEVLHDLVEANAIRFTPGEWGGRPDLAGGPPEWPHAERW
ncbi:MAG: PH domain-containing protein [Micrococcales bacterium]|nr:PH domain-containing protein [Micrococcales bacterium]